jgi:protein-tyrosine-phosphatase
LSLVESIRSDGKVRILKKLLFVCSGNTCRSPLAEGIAKKLFPEDLLKKVRLSSAGTSAVEGHPASSLAVEVALKRSIDLSTHRSRVLNRQLVKDADLIITMGAKHRETVGVIEPAALHYTRLLTDFCDEQTGDIPDPIGLGSEEYEETFRALERCIKGLAGTIGSFDGWKR